ncbi:MAG: NADH-quinone oxidoreductase subunit J [Actinobacteria bacterium]|nr:MAG: NADH-quinone oxidoreductase subunit J [Actinomycetota bacterium]
MTTALLAASSPYSTGQAWVFWVCGFLAVLGALGMILSRKAVHSALWVAMTMINLAILYVSLQAPFLGMVQIIVYTGAVMMLFLFVLMLVGVDSSDSLVETIKGQRVAAILFGFGFAALLVGAIVKGAGVLPEAGLAVPNEVAGGNVQGIGALVFSKYVFAFELTSALLISAALGAMLLAHRERVEARKSQRELSTERFELPGYPGPKPPPGVYARHNAVDTPALLPDGTTAADSVPGPLRARGSVRFVDPADVQEVADLTEGHAAIPHGDDDEEVSGR